ncbi:MAG TPA: hypothetical protein PLD73_16125 [Candidatus Hydrogenedentes bacterium]|nr:hypothetical protein [Candidatus Hydrogenedentota bacterium]HPJ99411.1 hypothetical protein [Candidatus Hydrogenedentota bacterium]
MKKRWVITAAVLLVVIGVIVVVLADRKYCLFPSPKFSHAPYVTPDTRVQIGLWPGNGGEDLLAILRAALPEKQRPSNWLLKRILPHEATVLLAPNLQSQSIAVTAFINDQRFGPVIRDAVNEANPSRSVPVVRWLADGMVVEKRGILTLRGDIPMDAHSTQLTQSSWPGAPAGAPLALEGGHAIEIMLDNRDGGAFAVLSSLELLKGLDGENNPDFYVELLANVSWLRLFADFAGTNDAALKLHIECRPDAEPGVAGSIQFVVDMGLMAAKKALEAKGAALVGASRVEGNAVVGDYTLRGLDKLIPAG